MKNKILSSWDVKALDKVIKEMYKTLPGIMSRKIPGSEVQAAFAIDYIMNNYSNKKILCVGSYEDVTYEYLRSKKIDVMGIDPNINFDLHTYKLNTDKKYDIIFSISVIEHVEKDEEFITDICDLLDINGIAVLTTDFNDSWSSNNKKDSLEIPDLSKSTTSERQEWVKKLNELKNAKINKKIIKKPNEDFRLYTAKDYERLSSVIEKQGCFFVDEFVADVEPYFHYNDSVYSFSTMVFRKVNE